MDVDCEGCAGCCVDWRALPNGPDDGEHRGRRPALDDAYNLVPLTREDVREFVDAGLGDALTPRLWAAAEGDDAVRIDGREVAAIDGRPAFFVGLRKPPKPVGPFGIAPQWLPACVFLDPETLQCRIHDTERYPAECAAYPGHNLALDAETECERVEAAFGRPRLLDGDPPADAGLLLGPQAVGETVFCYPYPDELAGVVERVVAGEVTAADRAAFVGVAAASAPGTVEVEPSTRAEYAERAREADSWAGRAVETWTARAAGDADDGRERADDGDGSVSGGRERAGAANDGYERRDVDADPAAAARAEEAWGAPPTPGWNT